MGDKDLKWAISEVMSKSRNKLRGIGMGDPDSGDFKPVSSHKLTFDSDQMQLEPIYYWILDFMQGLGWKMDKVIDNFMSSPGSGHFSEINMKATKMQEEGMKILGGLNQVIKSVLNLIYDLKEFELRLAHYSDASSGDKGTALEGILALKQVWLDNVDLKRGRGSIHQMAAEMGFTTIREAFMMANTQGDLEKLNDDNDGGIINDQVKRILIPRLSEFTKWKDYSEKELRKRFKIEKNYLKSQVETVKLYSAWMKPYFDAAQKLAQKGFDNHSALVNAFSTSMFELQLFGSKSVGPDDKNKRQYNQTIIINMVYRGHLAQRATQRGDFAYAYGGRVEMTFDSYALNDEELAAAKKLVEDETLSDSLSFSANVAEDALKELKADLDYFLLDEDEKKKKDENEKKSKDGDKDSLDINPFAALLSPFFKKKDVKKDVKKDENKSPVKPEEIKRDSYAEKKLRGAAIEEAAGKLYLVYDIYKKSHGLASTPMAFDDYDSDASSSLTDGGNVKFKDTFKDENYND